MSFVNREIALGFVFGDGPNGQKSDIAVDVTGLRVSCQVSRAGGTNMSSLTLRVWGLPIDVMRALTVQNVLAYEQVSINTITVTAGDSVNGYGVVFSGGIREAWVEAEGAPDVSFTLSAFEGLTDKVRPVPPTSFKGPASVDVLLSSIARQMQPPRTFVNHGVDVVLDNGYYPGTLDAQMQAVVQAARCEVFADSATIEIWPIGKARGGQIIEVSAASGLVGYPQFAQNGVNLTMLYSPSLSWGQKIRLRSVLGSPANADWIIFNVNHTLESETPGGQWFSYVECSRDGWPVPIASGA